MLRTNCKSILLAAAVLFCGAGTLSSTESRLVYGAMVYIASAPGDNTGALLAEEIAKRKLPILITPERRLATYILAGYVHAETGQAAAGITGGKLPNRDGWQGEAVLADAATHAITWKATIQGACKKCDTGEQSAEHLFAQKMIRRFQKDLFARESISDRIDDFIAP